MLLGINFYAQVFAITVESRFYLIIFTASIPPQKYSKKCQNKAKLKIKRYHFGIL